MLEKFLNKKVQVRYTGYTEARYAAKGIITNIDDEFIELDNNLIVTRKYILDIKSL